MSQRGSTPFGFQADILDGLTVAMTGLITGSKIGLLKAPITPQPNNTLAAVLAAEANFSGYAQKAVTAWQVAAKGPDGMVRVDSDLKQWLATDTMVSNTISGAFLVSSDGMTLQQVYLLPAPIVMGVDLLQAIDFFASFYFPPG